MEQKTFSIIMPAYNVEEYIEDSIKSVTNQTYKNYELLVIDDCSTDNTLNIVENLAKENQNIKVYQTPTNMRQGAARNIGLKNAEGKYLMFLDSDDMLYSEDVLEKLNAIVESKEPDLIYTRLKSTGCRDFEIIPTPENCERSYRLSEYKWAHVLTLCLKNDIVKENNITFPEGILYEDVYFNFLAISKCKNYEIGNFYSYLYNARPESSMGNKQFNQVRNTISLIEELCSLKDKIDPKDVPLLRRRINQQKSRILTRLNRVLDKLDCNIIDDMER